GGIAGSLLAGFVLLDLLGVWRSLALMTALYLVLSAIVTPTLGRRFLRGTAAVVLGLLLIPPLITRPLTVRLNADRRETVVQAWEGAHATVSVIRAQPEVVPGQRVEDLLIRINNLYTLGGLGSLPDERRQAHLPLLLHPEPRSVFFLGMATGITAGAALDHPVDRVVVAELVPEVVTAARAHFEPYVNGLFDDRRVQLVIDDGRSFLLSEEGRFDVVIADLFRPWASGTGTLYTREHFELVRDHLAEGGVFVQWLPLYQLSRREFGIITRTLLDVFPQVTLWRGNFNSDKPTAALVAQTTPAALSPETLLGNLEQLPRTDERFDVLVDMLVRVRGEAYRTYDASQQEFLAHLVPQLMDRAPFTFYAANLTETEGHFSDYPLNTQNRPEIEYVAPKTSGRVRAGAERWLTSFAALRLFDELADALPPSRDPYLADLDAGQRVYVQAGLSYFRSMVFQRAGDQEAAQRWFRDYVEKMGLDQPNRPK
ncbi:MAG: spermidine synthase, partial [Planctomycetota bacterium]